MSTALAITGEQTYWTPAQISALKQLGLSNASNGDLAFFFHQAQRTGLDPFARQIYMIERGGRYNIQTSIDGFRIIAQRSGKYRGQAGPYWCGEDGAWKDVWLKNTPPLAARVGVYADGWTEPLWAVAKWDSYAQQSPIWRKMPDLMLAKCAEALALRKAFPNDLSGVYTDDEMSQADIVTVEEKPKPQKVDLKAVPATEPTNIDWQVIDASLTDLTTKDKIEKMWNANKPILDAVHPKNGDTLREILLKKVALLK
jgi:phage recombination protein Bet